VASSLLMSSKRRTGENLALVDRSQLGTQMIARAPIWKTRHADRFTGRDAYARPERDLDGASGLQREAVGCAAVGCLMRSRPASGTLSLARIVSSTAAPYFVELREAESRLETNAGSAQLLGQTRLVSAVHAC